MRTLARGENASLTAVRLQVHVFAEIELDVSALLLGSDGTVAAETDFVFFNQPVADGVAVRPSGLDLDLDAVPATVERVLCVVSVEDHQPAFGAAGPLRATASDASGAPVVEFGLDSLSGERAVVVFEFYRRQGAWKVRAVGQGYDGGLGALVTRHGVQVQVQAPVPTSSTPAPAPPGTSDAERQFRVLTGIFEDASRSAAGYRSAVEFAEQRRERELGSTFDDPRLRESGGPARQMADDRYAELVTRATADHRRDVDALSGELRDLTPKLPAALAPWGASIWRAPGRFGVAAGVRAGELHLPEAPDLRLPLLIPVPLRRPIWFGGFTVDGDGSTGDLAGTGFGGADPFAADAATAGDGGVVAMARAIILRLLAADSSIRLHLCDIDGGLTAALGAVVGPDSTVLGAPVARSVQARSELIRSLVERLDLVEMARQAYALDALPMHDERALLVVTDVPVAFGEFDLRRLGFLMERCGHAVQVVVIGTPEDTGPSADLSRACLRLGPALGRGISDGWVGMAWTFSPDFGPTDAESIVFGR